MTQEQPLPNSIKEVMDGMPQAAEINTHRFPIEQGTKAYDSRVGMDGLKSLVVF